MGLLDLFRAKGEPVAANTVIKRMSENAGDFKGVALDAEDHPVDVFECGKIDFTGKRDRDVLYPCRETVSAIRNRIKKNQLVAFYLSAQEFELKFHWRNGGSTAMTARLDRTATSSLPSWLLRKFRNNGESVTAEALGRMLDNEFTSDAPPDWLKVSRREDIPEPEEPPEPEPDSAPETLTVDDLKPGVVVFDHYCIEKELGAGGQGMVFLATNMNTVVEAHRRVVLKVLRCENCSDESAMKDFIREANTLSNLRDERIAACYWCKVLGNVPILAMEYIEGESLDKYLADQTDGKISEEEARELLLPIAEALDYAHAKGIFHRDVKPQNIIVRKVPKKIGNKLIRTCLLDFGIASRDQGGGAMTSFWSVRGTLQYMSWEQNMSWRKPSASMDVYSLAVTAYECIMGVLPYPDGWDDSVRPEPIPLDSPFAKSVMRGLEMQPKDRPQTCAALIDPPKVAIDDSLTDDGDGDKSEVQKPGGPSGGGEKKTGNIGNVSENIPSLAKSFIVYRQMLAQSAQKCERENQRLAEWLRERQAELRDLTRDLGSADAGALERFFAAVKAERGGKSAEDFFAATDRIVELCASLPEKGGRVWLAIKNSIGK